MCAILSNLIIYIGLDDTDTLESRGTGNLARQIAFELAKNYELIAVTRHQLLIDPRIPSTAKNSCAAICLSIRNPRDQEHIFEFVKKLMLVDFQPSSDPGVCLADESCARKLSTFGARTKHEIINQKEARMLAKQAGAHLEGLAGSQDGIIGALAAVGLAASGDDGRYIQIGRSRDLRGLQTVPTILDAGIIAVRTLDGAPVETGLVLSDKLRPARRDSKPVLFVEREGEYWRPLKLD